MNQLLLRVSKPLFSVLVATIIALTAMVSAANAAVNKKIALVIGNSTYKFANTLPNPVRDAKLMSDTFRKAGFEVVDGLDLTKAQMGALLDRFTELAYDADVAVIYYAGHGIQVDGKNYLIPVDAELTSPAHLKSRTFEVSSMIATLPVDPSVGVVILDACRNNPFAAALKSKLPLSRSVSVSPGLAPVLTRSEGDGTGGILIAYATDPGAIALDGSGINSPYTEALARNLAVPGVEIQTALTRVRGEVAKRTEGRQRPWHNASLGREVYLGGNPSSQTDLLSGTIAISSADPVGNEPRSGTEVLAALPERETVTPVQPAISATTQKSNSSQDWQVEQRFWDEASKRNTTAHYQAYLSQYPNGQYVSMAKINISLLKRMDKKPEPIAEPVQMASVTPTQMPEISKPRTAFSIPDAVKNVPGTRQSERQLGLNRSERIDLQLRLEALGFPLGTADGSLGRKSRRAISAWQESHDILATSYLTSEQYSYLSAQSEPLMLAFMAARAKVSKRVKKRRATNSARRHKTNTVRKTRYNRRKTYRRKSNRSRRRNNNGAIVGAVAAGAVLGIIACKATGC